MKYPPKLFDDSAVPKYFDAGRTFVQSKNERTT